MALVTTSFVKNRRPFWFSLCPLSVFLGHDTVPHCTYTATATADATFATAPVAASAKSLATPFGTTTSTGAAAAIATTPNPTPTTPPTHHLLAAPILLLLPFASQGPLVF